MDINTLVLKHRLNDQEKLQFYDYIKNRFADIELHEAESLDYINVWENFIILSRVIGVAEIINKKICPKHPINFNNQNEIRLEIFDSFA